MHREMPHAQPGGEAPVVVRVGGVVASRAERPAAVGVSADGVLARVLVVVEGERIAAAEEIGVRRGGGLGIGPAGKGGLGTRPRARPSGRGRRQRRAWSGRRAGCVSASRPLPCSAGRTIVATGVPPGVGPNVERSRTARGRSPLRARRARRRSRSADPGRTTNGRGGSGPSRPAPAPTSRRSRARCPGRAASARSRRTRGCASSPRGASATARPS